MKIDRHATSIGLFPGEATLKRKDCDRFSGVARGGTSMVAGAARGLGFYMGHALENNNEDLEFKLQVAGADEEYHTGGANVQYRKWGWKFPAAANYLDELLAHVRNPHLIGRVPGSRGHVGRARSLAPAETSFAILRHTAPDAEEHSARFFGGACRRCWSVMKKPRCDRPSSSASYRNSWANRWKSTGKSWIAYLAPGKYKKFEDSVTADLPTDTQEQVTSKRSLRRPPRPSTCFSNVSNS